jgi:hypothetical protein
MIELVVATPPVSQTGNKILESLHIGPEGSARDVKFQFIDNRSL